MTTDDSSGSSSKAERNRAQVLERIGSQPEAQRRLMQGVHDAVLAAAPDLQPRIWYGMPGYARSASSPVLVFVRNDEGLITLGVSEKAGLAPAAEGDGSLLPSAWVVDGLDGIDGLDEATRDRVGEIVRAATG